MQKKQSNRINLERGFGYFNAVVKLGRDIYYSARYMNGLFRADPITGKSEFIALFDSEREEDIHRFAFVVRNEIWFVPNFFGDKIAIYNTDTLEIEYVGIPEPEKKYMEFLFMNFVIKDDYVWLIPGVYGACLCLNVRTKQVVKKVDLPKQANIELIYPVIQGCELNDKIYLCPWEYNKVLYLDLQTEKIECLNLEVEVTTYRNIFAIHNSLYLFPREMPNDIFIINLETNECERRTINTMELDTLIVALYLDSYEEKVFIFPELGEKGIYVLNIDTLEISEIIEMDTISNFSPKAFWRDVVVISEDLFFVIANEKDVPILMCHKQIFETFLLEGPKDLFVCRIVDQVERERKEKTKQQGDVGEKIYNLIFSDSQ